ncbi:MAG: ATP-binding protein [Coxiellaceae bacterium]|nr:ATP-binding protein [Coxiellaceae bacterium]
MLSRSMQAIFEEMMSQYPVVTIMGPRQSGKTTLAKNAYPGRAYFNLENPDTRALIEKDPRGFIDNINLKQGVILDEIQRVPDLLSYIQTKTDENRIPGSFILTGSHQLQLNEAISQSLAGRTALLQLLPLSLTELEAEHIEYDMNDQLLKGFFPAVYQHQLDAIMYASNYVKTYIERDVRQIINIKDLDCFQNFIKLCAGRVSSTLNYESLSNDVGMSQNTIKSWITVLKASYIAFTLQPYFENFGKRVIKAPKLYFMDTSIASYLLDIQSSQQMDREKLRGALFENMVIVELMKYRYNQGRDANLYFYRDSNQNEVDVVMQHHDKIIPIEIKSTATFSGALIKNIEKFQAMAGKKSAVGFLIYNGELEQKVNNVHVLNYKNMHKLFSIVEGYVDG